jgi:hypothetical protein
MFEGILELNKPYYYVMGSTNTNFITKNFKGPNVRHYQHYHSILESYGDCMCDELVKRSLATCNYQMFWLQQ